MVKLSRFDDLAVVSGPEWPGIRYFCSTRLGGISGGPWASMNMGFHTGDNPAHVTENRLRLTRSVPGPVAWVRQVHGTDVHDIDRCGSVGDGENPVSADGLVTARAHHALAIMTADCLPVVLGSADGHVIGVAHAGWRGLAGGILENTLRSLKQKYTGHPAPQWRAWIGPGISQSYFEVGDDVRQAFIQPDPAVSGFFEPADAKGKWLADLAGIARYRLTVSGVGHVDVSGLCTYGRPDLLYSYRRHSVTGRLVTVAWRTADSSTDGASHVAATVYPH